MAIGRGRLLEHLIYENKKGGNFLWSQDADVAENTQYMKIKRGSFLWLQDVDVVENTPNQHYVLLLLSKKYGKKVRKKVREKKYENKITGGKITG